MKTQAFSTKRRLAVGLAIVSLSIVGGLWLFINRNPTYPTTYSDDRMRENLGCNRVTADWRASDFFCTRIDLLKNPERASDKEIYTYLGCEDKGLNTRLRAEIGCDNPSELRQKFHKEAERLRS